MIVKKKEHVYYLEGFFTLAGRFLGDECKMLITCSLRDESKLFKAIVQSFGFPIQFRVRARETFLGIKALMLEMDNQELHDLLIEFHDVLKHDSTLIDIWGGEVPQWFLWDTDRSGCALLQPGDRIFATYSSTIPSK